MNMISSKLDGGVPPAGRGTAGRGLAEVDRVPIVQQYIRIAIRWRYVVIGVTAAFVLLGLIATMLMTPKYTASATIEISRESDKVTNIEGVDREASIADQEFYQTQYGLLRSRSLSERVATELRLVDDVNFFNLFGVSSDDPAFELTNGRYPAAGRATRQRVAGEILLDHLAIEPTRLSRLVEVGFTSPDADFSARVANAWSENFIRTNLERKIQTTSYGRDLLQTQLAQAKEKLDESQRQLVTYASAQQIINLPSGGGANGSGPERPIVADDLAALNAALGVATADRIKVEARYRQAGTAGASTEALNNSAINGLREKRAELASEYQRLMTQFEPNYPTARALQSQIDDLDRSIGREEGRVAGSYRADYRQAVEREQALKNRVAQLKSAYLDLRRRSIQYNIYEQEVDTNRVLYDGLLQRFKEIGVAGSVGVNNVAVVDTAAVPQKPSSPVLLLNLAVAFIAGLGLGTLVAFALDQMDDAISDPGQMQQRFGLPFLGSIPKVKGESPLEALRDRKSELVDAYLAVHSSLSFATEHGVPRSFAVTSTRPSEGKSTTALALATTLARTNRKVILVDGDMRSPSVHHLGGVDHDRGLSNFLAGQDDIEPLTFRMDDLGITAMSAGPIPPNAAELLTGHRLPLLIERLLEQFDHVVIDSPPVMGLADAPLIANRVEGVIYAVESHGIRSGQVKKALGRLIGSNIHLIGGVLTKFEARRGSHSYDYEYGYSYGRDAKTASA